MTAPQSVFEGEHGVWNAVGKFDWPSFGGDSRPYRISGTQFKMYPAEYHGQTPIEAAIALSPVDPDDVEAIVVETYWFAWSEIGNEPEKWAPTTRETADHSIPYLVCAALLDGKVDPASFTEARMKDPALRSLMQKVKVIHNKELDAFQPMSNPCRLKIRLNNGEERLSSVNHAKGYVNNPPSDQDLQQKLVNLNGGLLSSRRISKLIDLCWRFEELDDVRSVISEIRLK